MITDEETKIWKLDDRNLYHNKYWQDSNEFDKAYSPKYDWKRCIAIHALSINTQ